MEILNYPLVNDVEREQNSDISLEDMMAEILNQLKIMNIHLSELSGEEIEGDII